MAKYNEILVGRYNRALQKLLGMKGSAVAPQLSSDIQPSLMLYYGTENRYLEGWNRFAATLTFNASVGNQNVSRLRNPAASNVIAVIEKVLVSTPQTATTQHEISQGVAVPAGDFGTVSTLSNTRMDPRGNPAPSMILTSGQIAAPATLNNILGFLLVGIAAGVLPQQDLILDSIHEVPLLPGDAIQIRETVVNVSVFHTIWWRERFLEESERA